MILAARRELRTPTSRCTPSWVFFEVTYPPQDPTERAYQRVGAIESQASSTNASAPTSL